MLQDRKLKSIGELAAGIAHEINTPTQYVINNTVFLRDTFKDITSLIESFIALKKTYSTGVALNNNIEAMLNSLDTEELDYVIHEIPQAIGQSIEGLERIASIVQSMKSFSHPGHDAMVYHNINKALNDTVTITKNEWKYHAVIETKLDEDLPEVLCYPAEINQVFLNIIVNAAHATKEAVEKGIVKQGIITLSTKNEKTHVQVSITDNGVGISDNVRSRIFDPFFTTKEVGKGSGQGLAIAHSIIVQKHQGTIMVESREKEGAVFTIRLPL